MELLNADGEANLHLGKFPEEEDSSEVEGGEFHFEDSGENGKTHHLINRKSGIASEVPNYREMRNDTYTESIEPLRQKGGKNSLRIQPTTNEVTVEETAPEQIMHHQFLKKPPFVSEVGYRSASVSDGLSTTESPTIAFVNGVFADRVHHLETGASEAFSHLQVTDTTHDKQIVNQLLTGMLGTGLGMMQGMATGGMAGGAAATPMVAAAPAVVSPLLPGSGPTLDMGAGYYDRSGLSTFEIVSICAGALLAVGLVGLLLWLMMSRTRKRHR